MGVGRARGARFVFEPKGPKLFGNGGLEENGKRQDELEELKKRPLLTDDGEVVVNGEKNKSPEKGKNDAQEMARIRRKARRSEGEAKLAVGVEGDFQEYDCGPLACTGLAAGCGLHELGGPGAELR